jgi:hypothetical protein
MVFIYIYVFFMAILSLVAPETIWKMRHWFSVKNGEPSEGFLITTRISGVIILIALFYFIFRG